MSQIELLFPPRSPNRSLSCLSKSDLHPVSVSGQTPGSWPWLPSLSLTLHVPSASKSHGLCLQSASRLRPLLRLPHHHLLESTLISHPKGCRTLLPGLSASTPCPPTAVHSLHTARWSSWLTHPLCRSQPIYRLFSKHLLNKWTEILSQDSYSLPLCAWQVAGTFHGSQWSGKGSAWALEGQWAGPQACWRRPWQDVAARCQDEKLQVMIVRDIYGACAVCWALCQ